MTQHHIPGEAPDPAPTAMVHPQHAAPSLSDDLLGSNTLPANHSPRHPAESQSAEPHSAAIQPAAPSSLPDHLLLRTRGLTMEGRESTVFGPVDLDLPKGDIGVIVGQQGSGRSALLLALTGRLKGVQGELRLADIDGIAHPRALRKQTSVARISGLVELEPNLTIGESRDERAIADGIGQRRGRERFSELEKLLDHRFQTDQWVDRMPAVERTLLTLVLGCLAPSLLVVLDDVDDSLTDAQLRLVHQAIAALQTQHAHVVLSALEESPLPDRATVVHLPPATRHDTSEDV